MNRPQRGDLKNQQVESALQQIGLMRTSRHSTYAAVYVETLGISKHSEKSGLLQGTLDMLILKIVALGPIHGYGIAQRIQQISREVLQVQPAEASLAASYLETEDSCRQIILLRLE